MPAKPSPPLSPPAAGAGEVLVLLLAINVLNYFDRQLLGAVAEPVRREFHLGDGQLGLLSTAFTLVYAVAGLPLGRLSDGAGRGAALSRAQVLLGGVLAFSLATALSGLARGYGQLFAARLLVGVGEAACAPAAAALCGSLFPRERRARAMAVFMLGLPLGVALSFGISGPLTRAYGWRVSFLLAGVPGVLVALWTLRLPRQSTEATAASTPGRVLARLWQVPALGWLICAGVLHTLLMQVLALFLSPFLMRCHGLDVQGAGLWSMLLFGLVGVPGLLLGGALGDAVARRGSAARLWLGAMSSLLLALPLWAALGLPRGAGMLRLALLLGPACGLLYLYYSTVYATLQDLAPPDLRGTVMAVYLFAMYLLGAALGPYAAGALSDHFASQAAVLAGVSAGTRQALEPFRAAGLAGALQLLPGAALLLALVLALAARALRGAAPAGETRLTTAAGPRWPSRALVVAGAASEEIE